MWLFNSMMQVVRQPQPLLHRLHRRPSSRMKQPAMQPHTRRRMTQHSSLSRRPPCGCLTPQSVSRKTSVYLPTHHPQRSSCRQHRPCSSGPAT